MTTAGAQVARHPSLRQMITIAAVALSLMAVAVSGALVVLTTNLHDSSMVMRDMVRTTRVAREAQLDLLTHAREDDPARRAKTELDLRENLAETANEAGSSAARRSAEQARVHVEHYLQAAPQSARADASFGAAMDALEHAVDAGVLDADRIEARVGAWTRSPT